MTHPTPLKWMGRTIQQNQILRYIDRENPFGEILCIRPVGRDTLIVTDGHCTDHRLTCLSDGTVCLWEDREEAPA